MKSGGFFVWSVTEQSEGYGRGGPFEVPEVTKGTNKEGRGEAALTKFSDEVLACSQARTTKKTTPAKREVGLRVRPSKG
jgi:hypothetical protein